MGRISEPGDSAVQVRTFAIPNHEKSKPEHTVVTEVLMLTGLPIAAMRTAPDKSNDSLSEEIVRRVAVDQELDGVGRRVYPARRAVSMP